MRTIVDRIIDGVTNLIDANPPISYSTKHGFSGFGGSGTRQAGAAELEAMGSLGTLFAIVNQTSTATAKTKWRLFRVPVTANAQPREVLSHAFLDLWNKPNPYYTGRLFRETVQQHLDLIGEGTFALVTMGNMITEMWPFRPDRLEVVPSRKEFIKGYIYHSPDGEKVPLTKEEVIHIKMPNPSDPYRGMGPVQTMLADIDSARFSAEWNRNFFLNSAQPGGIVKVDHALDDEEFNRFHARWREQHQGIHNAHRVALLEMGEWIEAKYSMEDMQFVELRNLPRELIREAFAFPKPMLGTVDDVNRANAEAGKEIMAEGQTVPRLERWQDIVNSELLPRFQNGRQLMLQFDDPVPVNREAADRERNSKATSWAAIVNAGGNPDDASEATGLPRIRLQPKPTPAPPQPTQPSEEGARV